jgi:pre-mRNA-splicing factor CWC26
MSSSKGDHVSRYAEKSSSSEPNAQAEKGMRGREMSEDPMLEYFRQKEREKQGTSKELPKYKGPYPPNRYNLRPGYRWDGVDRSNGYEKKLLERESQKRAGQEDAYRRATLDL